MKLPLELKRDTDGIEPLLERFVSCGYLLHGSPFKLDRLTPQIALVNQHPEVYATSLPKYALFYAVVRGGRPNGFVYICSSAAFAQRFPFESYATCPITPLMRVPVKLRDLKNENQSIYDTINDILTCSPSVFPHVL